MLNVTLNQEAAVALLQPDGVLTVSDFESAEKVIDAFINEAGKLNGIIIYTKSFPGWDSFAALMTHIRFIREHHQEVACIAFVTDSPIGGIAPKNLDRFLGENFLKGFFSKGRMEPLMRDMPVKVILNEQTALYGSAVFAGTSGG